MGKLICTFQFGNSWQKKFHREAQSDPTLLKQLVVALNLFELSFKWPYIKNTKNWCTTDALGAILTILDTFTKLLQYSWLKLLI